MILAEYGRPEHTKLLAGIDDRYPIFFLERYSSFRRGEGHSQFVLIMSDCGSICVPVRLSSGRFFKALFRFKVAQFEYPPVKAGQRLEPPEEAQFLGSVIDYMRRSRLCHRVIQSPPHCVFKQAPPGATFCRFGSYVLNLRGRSEEELFEGMHPDHRREIKRAREKGTHVEFGLAQLDNCFRLCFETMQRSGLPFMYKSEFYALHNLLSSPPECSVCGVVYHQGIPLGALSIPFTKARAFYLSGGSAEQMTEPGANKLLHWETIRYLRLKGVAEYDFVGARLSDVRGTKLEHLQRFKARFGGNLEQGCLWKTDIAKPVAHLFDLLAALRRRLRGEPAGAGDIIDQERRKETAAVGAS